jgi:hypothetical protein
MASDLVSPSADQRCIIKFLVKEKVKPEEFLRRLNAQYGENTLSCASVCNRYNNFSPTPKTFKTQLSAGKIMASVFWDSGVIHVYFLPCGTKINAQYYGNLLRNDAHQEIGKKSPGKLSKMIKLLHDNARPHTVNLTKATLATMGWEIMNHPS